MTDDSYIENMVNAGIEAFLKSEDAPFPPKGKEEKPKDKEEKPKDDDVDELPEREEPESETPDLPPADEPTPANPVEKFLHKPVGEASDEELITLTGNIIQALGM
jgi:hypothetical protein